jgi:tetratricopeptide (TPR) repeat protein
LGPNELGTRDISEGGRMKAEHRKELETNKLADTVGGFVQSFKEGPSKNAIIYGSIIGVAFVLLIIYWWVAGNAAANSSSRWLQLEQINDRGQLEQFTKEYPDTEQGRLARFQLARLDLDQGIRGLGWVDKTEATKRVRRAAESYEKLAGESGNTPLLAQEALLNAAKGRESLGEYDQAKQLYGRLARDYPQSLKGKYAAEQVEALKTSGPELDELKQIVKDTTSEPIPVPAGPP